MGRHSQRPRMCPFRLSELSPPPPLLFHPSSPIAYPPPPPPPPRLRHSAEILHGLSCPCVGHAPRARCRLSVNGGAGTVTGNVQHFLICNLPGQCWPHTVLLTIGLFFVRGEGHTQAGSRGRFGVWGDSVQNFYCEILDQLPENSLAAWSRQANLDQWVRIHL